VTKRHPWLAAFFAFGTLMCSLTVLLLLVPDTALDSAWRINPEGYHALHSIGAWAFPLMVAVGTGCGFAAVGLWRGRRWGSRLALLILSINLAGDLFNALERHDYRTLIGVPIAIGMIVYLVRTG